MEQSTFGETVNGKLIPQSLGRVWAAWAFGFIFWAAVLMHSQAAFLSAEVDAADARPETPEQHAAGGYPVPFSR